MNTIYSFENELSQDITAKNSTIELSRDHARDGNQSLKWSFEPNAQLCFNTNIPFSPLDLSASSKAVDTFVLWLCSESFIDGELDVQFYKKDVFCCGFTMQLGFAGWRTGWVSYERDMLGTPQPNMDGIKIIAKTHTKGTLYLDQIITVTKIDSRNHAPDYHFPFVHTSVVTEANSHWLSIYKFMQMQTKGVQNSTTPPNLADINTIKSRFEEYILQNAPSVNHQEAFAAVKALGFANGGVRRVDILHIRESFPKSAQLLELTDAAEFRDVGIAMQKLAIVWHTSSGTEKAQVAQLYIHIFKHLLYLGYACGSALGTTHHIGYQIREYVYSLFLMRSVLQDEGLLQKAADVASWYCGSGRAFGSDAEISQESLDTFNTLSHGMLVGALLQESPAHTHTILLAFKRWLNSCLLPAPGLEGPFKTDNCMFHHCNHYPAYAIGGIERIAPFIYFISATPYKINEKAHESVKNAVLAFRIYCNHTEWSIGMSSRHPDGSGTQYSGLKTLDAFKYLAMSGSPDGTEAIDTTLAAAYMRLYPYVSDQGASPFTLAAEKTPNGHWNFNYGCSAVHRRSEWMFTVRGFSRYIWGNESYVGANLYGRYIAYGQLELLNRGTPISHEASGYSQFGWDWNFWPATTAIALPFEFLRSDVRNVDTFSGFEEMLISDEAFCGGAALCDNGVFAIKLHEHAKYNATHRARKSYFFIDDYVVCLGSSIENISEYSTFTTIFQKSFSKGEKLVCNDVNITPPYSAKITTQSPTIIRDNKGNSYCIAAGQQVKLEIKSQTTPNHENDKPCTGDFAKALICHGVSPTDAQYEYALLAGDNIDPQAFASKLPYTVLNKNKCLHAIKSQSFIYQVFFEATDGAPESCINRVDAPCITIEKHTDTGITLAICDPDMRFYEGIEPDQLNSDGTQKEVSLYSRKWQGKSSVAKPLALTLNGTWAIDKTEMGTEINYKENTTIITQLCSEAKTYTLLLKQIN